MNKKRNYIKKEDRFMDRLPHVGYEEVKVTSDSDEDVDHEDFHRSKKELQFL